MSRHLAASITVVVALMVWTAPAAHATTTNISCGATITQSVTLTRDLNCTGIAVYMDSTRTAAPVVVNLAGHTISSPHFPAIRVSSGIPVTVENGRIAGIVFDMILGGRFTHLVFDGGILESRSSRPVIRDNRFVHGATVETIESSPDIENNQFSSVTGQGTAMSLAFSWARVIGNTVTGYEVGIQITDVTSSANVQRNVVSRNGTGIRIGGIGFDAIPGNVSGNWALANRGDGILLGVGSGVEKARTMPGLTANNNVALFNGGDGIHIDPVSPIPNGILGIMVTVSDNLAVGNATYGIESPGTIPPNIRVSDGGGNIAGFNGNPAQCVNVACEVR